MIRALGRRTGEAAITYNILIRLREHCGRIAHIPPGTTLKELLSEQDAADLVKSARLTTIETLFSLPRELPVAEDFASPAVP
jgi:ATP sulfurylase